MVLVAPHHPKSCWAGKWPWRSQRRERERERSERSERSESDQGDSADHSRSVLSSVWFSQDSPDKKGAAAPSRKAETKLSVDHWFMMALYPALSKGMIGQSWPGQGHQQKDVFFSLLKSDTIKLSIWRSAPTIHFALSLDSFPTWACTHQVSCDADVQSQLYQSFDVFY